MIKVEKLRWKFFHKIVWKSDYVLRERFFTISGECSTSLRKTALTNLPYSFVMEISSSFLLYTAKYVSIPLTPHSANLFKPH